MAFQFSNARNRQDAPEINLIAFIDVLLVVLIFLMLTTTFSRLTQMQLTLPVAQSEPLANQSNQITVEIAADGRYAINGQALADRSVAVVAQGLASVTAQHGGANAMVILKADASAPHQAIITVMEAARRTGLARLAFAAQTGAAGR